jgi:hypothetical protein
MLSGVYGTYLLKMTTFNLGRNLIIFVLTFDYVAGSVLVFISLMRIHVLC